MRFSSVIRSDLALGLFLSSDSGLLSGLVLSAEKKKRSETFTEVFLREKNHSWSEGKVGEVECLSKEERDSKTRS